MSLLWFYEHSCLKESSISVLLSSSFPLALKKFDFLNSQDLTGNKGGLFPLKHASGGWGRQGMVVPQG